MEYENRPDWIIAELRANKIAPIIPIYTKIRSHKHKPNKTQRINAIYPSLPPIPIKPPTKPQQKVIDRNRNKKQAQKAKQLPRSTLPPSVFAEKLTQQQTLNEQRKQKVIGQKRKEMSSIPIWLRHDQDTNVNHNKRIRRSTRIIRPSQSMIHSQQSEIRLNGGTRKRMLDEVIGESDDDDI